MARAWPRLFAATDEGSMYGLGGRQRGIGVFKGTISCRLSRGTRRCDLCQGLYGSGELFGPFDTEDSAGDAGDIERGADGVGEEAQVGCRGLGCNFGEGPLY